jgi:hypothetical protein
MRARRRAAGALAATLALAGSGCAGKSSYRGGEPEADVRAAAADAATVSPLPGTVDASPQTQISFLGPRGMRVSGVRVVGSRSGAHDGVLRAYSTGTGASFLPRQPFLAGENVTAEARVGSRVPRRTARTTFRVGRPVPVSQSEFPHEPGDPSAVQRYASAPGLTPSSVAVTTPAQPGASRGELFLAPYQGEGSPGPMIVDRDGALVWFHPLPADEAAANFSVQRYRGRPALVWWQGRIIQAGFGQGEDVVYDSSYRRVASVRAGNGYSADLHAVHLTPHGTAWIDAFAPVQADLTAVGGPRDGVLTDSIVQQVDIDTGLVMWEWHALGHIALEESQVPVSHGSYPWDYAHVNAIDPGSGGHVLLSARSTCALYDVDIHSGGVRWRLGGTRSSFKPGPGAAFYWQHDARFQPGGRISMFDNGSEPPRETQSRGIVLAPHEATHSVSLVRQFVNPTRNLLAVSQGSMVELDGGNWIIGYGRLPDFTEFDASGRVLLDATLGRNVQNFSVGLSEWSGRPRTRPSAVAKRLPGGRLAVRVSWNGATEVDRWRLLTGAAPGALTPAVTVTRTGFETAITGRASSRYFSVQALDRTGAVIGATAAARG